MANIYSRAELVAKIKQIDIDIANSSSALKYAIDSGMSRQSVERNTPESLLALRKYYENMLDDLDDINLGTGMLPMRGR